MLTEYYQSIALELRAATLPLRAFVFISKKRGFKNG